MSRIPIQDVSDPRIAIYRALKSSQPIRHRDAFIVEGRKLVERLLASRYPVISLLGTDRDEASLLPLVPPNVPLFILPRETVDVLVGFRFHQGILGCGRRLPPSGLEDILSRSDSPTATLLACPRIDNPENLGALLRLADVFDVAGLLLGQGPDPLSRRVLRVSMGTSLRIPTVLLNEFEIGLADLRGRGWSVLAAVTDPSAVPIDQYRPSGRVVLMLGPEGAGLESSWVERSERAVTIPMRPGAESLNVAVAAGILLYHLTRGGGSPCDR